MKLCLDQYTKISEVCRMMPISTLNLKYSNGCRFHIKFHKSSIYELNFYIRSMPKLPAVRAELNFERSFIKTYFSKKFFKDIYSRARQPIFFYLLYLCLSVPWNLRVFMVRPSRRPPPGSQVVDSKLHTDMYSSCE